MSESTESQKEQTEKLFYSIGEVSEMFELNASTLRFWEKEFDFLKPGKNKKGNRLFTQKDIDNIARIVELVKNKGYTIQGAREQFKSADGAAAPSFTDLIVKLSARALVKYPALASRLIDDRVVPPSRIDIGFAVDTEAGLLVPVIRDVPALGLRDIAIQSRDLIERARSERLAARDMEGGCFTVTNLGAFGIDAFTPIINYPECAILGVGRIERRPVMDGDRVVGREQVTLSLTFDHRVVDGAPAARFLQALGQMIANPAPWVSS